MISVVYVHHLFFLDDNNKERKPCNRNPNRPSIRISTPSFPSTKNPFKNQPFCNFKQTQLHCVPPWNSSQNPLKRREALPIVLFSVVFLCLRMLFCLLPHDFSHRWQTLVVFSEEAEARVSSYPCHLWQAVVASEDRRFFRHFGVDPIGIARAVLSFSASGGGSTITQQLVKNTLLRNERTYTRKVIELVLALILERRISKWKILSTYLSKIYWGHGVYGIESASLFYFGKHPSHLSLGESAMLVGIIPAPELRSPLKHYSRGKIFQARALRRMVEVGFLDIETALAIVSQPLNLCVDGPKHPNGIYLSDKEIVPPGKGSIGSTIVDIMDWERESCMWELREYKENLGNKRL